MVLRHEDSFRYGCSNRLRPYNHGTAANVHDIVQAHALIREDDHSVYGDSGYLGVEKRAEIREDPPSFERGLPHCQKTFTEPHNKGVCRSQLGQEDRTREIFHSLQGGASIPHREASVPSGQDEISRPQEEPAPLLSALCVGEPRHVSEGRKAEGILHDNGISAPFS